ncbi:MAG: hypothetical protein JKY93_01860 [Gammaproteobacteria bacterium]|nr:hypothetical protein [Gammaproteobacteria bacterium]
MAGDWIKFELATLDKAEIWEIADRLQLDTDSVIGKLIKIWAWFDQHTEDGSASIVTKKLLDSKTNVTNFCDILVTVGWMECDENTISIPKFSRHNGESAKKRAEANRRKAESRKKVVDLQNIDGKEIDSQESHIDVTKSCDIDVTKIETREEKRREEKNKDINIYKGISFSEFVDHIDVETMKGFVDHRAGIKNKPKMTQRAFDLNMKSALKARSIGMTAETAIDTSVAKGWIGITVEYLANLTGQNVNPVAVVQRAAPVYEKKERAPMPDHLRNKS